MKYQERKHYKYCSAFEISKVKAYGILQAKPNEM